MRHPLRSTLFACALIALGMLVAIGSARGNGFDLNHYILRCGDACPSLVNPVPFNGSIDARFTGAWYDPDQNGQGLFVEILPDHRATAYWFTFDPVGGSQAWVAGTGTYTGSVITFDTVAKPNGGRWIPNFDASRILDRPWGTMTLTFDSFDHGKLEFASILGYGTGSMNLVRLTRPAGIAIDASPSSGQWVPAGAPSVARYGHTATLLDDGRVLVAGGLDHAGATDSAELYDPSTGTWSAIAPLSSARAGHAATKLADGKVLLFGGVDKSNRPLRRADLYDPVTDRWSSFDAPGWTLGPTATLLRTGKVLVVGGYPDGKDAFHLDWLEDRAVLFDPATRTWSRTGNLPELRLSYLATATLATLLRDGRVLLTGGNDNDWGCPVYSTQTYDPATNLWSTGGDIPFGWGHTATLLPDGRVLAVGEADESPCGGTNAPAVAELYDPSTGLWTRGASARVYREDHSAALLPDGRVLIAGGRQAGSFGDSSNVIHFAPSLDAAEIYDPRTGSWSNAAPLITPRATQTATVLHDGRVLFVGGCCANSDTPWNGVAAYGPTYNSVHYPSPRGGAELFGTGFPPGSIVPAMTGSWFDPMQKGHGILVEVLPGAQILAWWFAFNPAGTEQAWFGGLGSYSGNTATITAVDQPTGGRFIPNFDATKITHNPWGSLKLTFADCDHGKVEFATSTDYGSGSMNLTRLTRPAGVVCP